MCVCLFWVVIKNAFLTGILVKTIWKPLIYRYTDSKSIPRGKGRPVTLRLKLEGYQKIGGSLDIGKLTAMLVPLTIGDLGLTKRAEEERFKWVCSFGLAEHSLLESISV